MHNTLCPLKKIYMGGIINSYFIDKKTLLKEIKLLAQWKSLGNSDSKTSPPPAFWKLLRKKTTSKNSWDCIGLGRSWCHMLGSFHSILTMSKKLDKLKNQQLFLDHPKKQGNRADHCSPNWRDQQADQENHNLPEQKLMNQNSLGKGAERGKSELSLIVRWKLKVDKSESLKFWGAGHMELPQVYKYYFEITDQDKERYVMLTLSKIKQK